ncbi:MAG: histidine--tRNA ligase [Acidobacteriota bacterium]
MASSKKKGKKPRRVKARISRGLRDLMPHQLIARQRMIDAVRGVYERYGYAPLATPAVEYLDVLLGAEAGEEAKQSIFTVSNREEEALGLRFDLTVPLARVVAQHGDLPRPFRRYQVASVWRGDKPDKGRFREFTQFDIDAVGVQPGLADVEILAAMCDVFEALGVARYRVRFSNRLLLDALLRLAGVDEARASDVFRVLDKLDKIGPEKVRLELTAGYVDASGDPIRGVGLDDAQVDTIERFLAIRDERREAVLAGLRELFRLGPESDTESDAPDDAVPGAAAAVAQVATMSRQLARLGYGDDKIALDLSIARGLAYYTGAVFEAILLDAPQFGSVFGGGRYDGLVARFSGQAVPAVGASVGVDRLLAALEHLDAIDTPATTVEVLVTRMDAGLEDAYLDLTFELRRAGIHTELWLGGGRNVGKQLKYADRCQVPIALLMGPDEADQGIVTLKDMDAGRRQSETIEDRDAWLAARPGQREVPRDQVVATVRALLETIAAG